MCKHEPTNRVFTAIGGDSLRRTLYGSSETGAIETCQRMLATGVDVMAMKSSSPYSLCRLQNRLH